MQILIERKNWKDNPQNVVKWWNSIVDIEENDLDDEMIHRLLRWKEIRRNLKGVNTILDYNLVVSYITCIYLPYMIV
ncbi:hypothetical protein SAMN04488542_1401 [Fontibacillus panacisegetis]|uniref:Uncharacterized protein n=1 Tax=Fontibacillus panacisegetis TaxID=670482 RepID=A0A1G7TVI8_9BACL|nr:hypothetical protein SAMN04488542_1401 [Fontibacillus panacisegetis]